VGAGRSNNGQWISFHGSWQDGEIAEETTMILNWMVKHGTWLLPVHFANLLSHAEKQRQYAIIKNPFSFVFT
jgi:hypothetical protein